MSHRPERLPILAMRVFKAAPALPWGVKAVWIEDWHLDLGPEGSWLSAPKLAIRIGLAKDTVEDHRRRLADLHLYHVVERKGLGQSFGWIPQMPEAFVPVVKKMEDSEILIIGLRFGEYLSGLMDGAIKAVSPPASNTGPDNAINPVVRDAINAVVRHASPPTGGLGGSSPSSLHPQEGRKSPHLLPLDEADDVARATRKDEKMRR